MPSCSQAKIKNVHHDGCLKVKPLHPENEIKTHEIKMPKLRKTIDSKETVKYLTNEGMREILVPSKDTNYYPVKIKYEELDRLQKQAVHISERDRLRMYEESEKEKIRLAEESLARKKHLQQFDVKGGVTAGAKLTDMEREAKDKANYLLKRAWELKKEDEDEVKLANSLILKTKCQAIRDAQLAERKLMTKEMKEEEKRIEKMMEDEKVKLIIEEKRKIEELRAKKERYVKELNQQVEEIEARRLMEAETKVEEGRRVNEAMYLVMFEELEKMKELEEIKKQTRDALNAANEQIRRAQELEREECRLADLKMQEYMRRKAEREEKMEKEKEDERKRKELETARLRALQGPGDLQAIQEEMAAVRRQEEYERSWRKKEMEEALKRQKMEESTKIERERQVRDIHKVQAMELAREKREYEKILKIQLEIQEKERLLELKKKHDAEVYREAILKQINEKEREKIEERQQKFAEGRALKAEDAKRHSEIRQILEKKLDQLRINKVPEMYIAEIQRQLHLKDE